MVRLHVNLTFLHIRAQCARYATPWFFNDVFASDINS